MVEPRRRTADEISSLWETLGISETLGKVTSVREEPAGGVQQIFRCLTVSGQVVIAKSFREATLAERESRILRLVEGAAVAAEILFTDPTNKLIVYRYLEGDLPVGRPVADVELSAINDLWRRLDRLTERFHGTNWTAQSDVSGPRELFEREITPLYDYCRQARNGDLDTMAPDRPLYGIFTRAQNLLDHCRLPSGPLDKRLCHGSCQLINVVIGKDGRARFLNWTSSGLGDPAFDLARFVHAPQNNFLTNSQRREFAVNFCRRRNQADDLRQYLRIYNALVPLWWACQHTVFWMQRTQQQVPSSARYKSHWNLSTDTALFWLGCYLAKADEGLRSLGY